MQDRQVLMKNFPPDIFLDSHKTSEKAVPFEKEEDARESLLDKINRCARCGKCRSVCQVFQEIGHEGFAARGRIALLEALLKGELKPGRETRKIFQACLKCLKCVETCPAGVDYSDLFLKMQDAVCTPLSPSVLARFFFSLVLPRRLLMDTLMSVSRAFQTLLPRKGRGTLRHLPLLFSGKRSLPRLASRSALKSLPRLSSPGNARGSVGIFLGCLINYCYPQIAAAMIRVLNRLGIAVIVPKGQVCCGAPLQYYGYTKGVRGLAERNTEVFLREDCEAVLTACATGGRTLRLEYPKILGRRGKEFSQKVFDVSEYIATFHMKEWEALVRERGSSSLPVLTYHDACHLLAGRNIREEPRRLLESCGPFREAPGRETCCGGGGLFSIYYPSLSEQIGKKRVGDLLQAQAGILATGCPGCLMQIEEKLIGEKDSPQVLHTIQVLDRFLDLSEEYGDVSSNR